MVQPYTDIESFLFVSMFQQIFTNSAVTKKNAMMNASARSDLDVCVPTVPAVFYRRCHHVAVLNSAALKACSIGRETEDGADGEESSGIQAWLAGKSRQIPHK